MSKTKRKVVVIGGGAIGIATASWLIRDDHDVTVIESGEIGAGASFGNAGCLNASSVVPMSMPGMLGQVPGWLLDPLGPLSIRWTYLPKLMPWLLRFIAAGSPARIREQAKALQPLLHDSYGTYWPLVQNAGAEDLVRREGHLVVYRSEEKLAGDSLGWKLRRDNGIELEKLDQTALRDFDPALSTSFKIGLLIKANGHTVNPHRLINKLAAAFIRDGGRIIRTKAKDFHFENEKLRSVGTLTGPIPADVAVVAAGAHSKPFSLALGDRIPLDTERGYHIVIANPEVAPRVPTLDAEGKFVATPMEMGLRLAGTVEFAGLNAAPDWRRARKLLTLGRRLLPGLPETITEDKLSTWMGFRPSMPDSLPVIGPSRRSRDILYAFGHGHIGLASAAQTGRVIADMVAGRTPFIDISMFRADRFM